MTQTDGINITKFNGLGEMFLILLDPKDSDPTQLTKNHGWHLILGESNLEPQRRRCVKVVMASCGESEGWGMNHGTSRQPLSPGYLK